MQKTDFHAGPVVAVDTLTAYGSVRQACEQHRYTKTVTRPKMDEEGNPVFDKIEVDGETVSQPAFEEVETEVRLAPAKVMTIGALAEAGLAPIIEKEAPPAAPFKVRTRGTKLADNGDGTFGYGFIETDMPDEQIANRMRSQRNRALADCDWVVTKAFEQGEAVPAEWATYRQALRDLPVHKAWPKLADADWPEAP